MSSLLQQLKFLRFPLFVLMAGIAFAWVVGGLEKAFMVAVLAVFEVTMSFNNAVINATVLQRMNRFWQRMFLSVGLIIAVFGLRFLFPIWLVQVTAHLGFGAVFGLALNHPVEYASKVALAHASIAAYGGMFLLMLFLDFVIDETKNVHWLSVIEKPLARAGRLKTLPVLLALVSLALVTATWGRGESVQVLVAGVAGLVTYLLVRGLSQLFVGLGGVKSHSTMAVGKAALALFVYLEVLDASFSFDGVVGAFAISDNVLTIALGLGIGALFMRELTIWMVRHRTLQQFKYLEHGAQYSVGALAILLAAGLAYNIPDYVTGLVGTAIIALALWSSVLERRQTA
jgi:uncharacterized protein